MWPRSGRPRLGLGVCEQSERRPALLRPRRGLRAARLRPSSRSSLRLDTDCARSSAPFHRDAGEPRRREEVEGPLDRGCVEASLEDEAYRRRGLTEREPHRPQPESASAAPSAIGSPSKANDRAPSTAVAVATSVARARARDPRARATKGG